MACSVADSSSVIHIEPFLLGMAPAILMNDTKIPIIFRQVGNQRSFELLPGQMKAFTWSSFALGMSFKSLKFSLKFLERKLEWLSGDYISQNELVRNDYGSYLPSKDSSYLYWVSFFNDRQRILLFTTDISVMTTAYQAYEVITKILILVDSLKGIFYLP